MKIYFGCSTSQFLEYQEQYFALRDFIVEEGHVITRDWLQIFRHELVNAPEKLLLNQKGPEEVYKKATEAFYKSEIMIAENTIPSFSNGHLMTLALQRKMPVLVLQFNNRPKRYLKRSFIQGIKSEYLEIADYDMNNYKDIIGSFLKKYENAGHKTRFNLVIDEVERKYLDWAENKYDLSRTKVIRESLRKAINEDEDYKKFLRK
jgi:hypothetical protein